MKLKPMPKHLDDVALPMMSFTDKLILGGSTSLYMLGVLDRVPHDLDFSLREKLTPSELRHIVDFFNLEYNKQEDDYSFEEDMDGSGCMVANEPTIETILSRDLIQFEHYSIKDDSIEQDYKIDIFNHKTVTKGNILNITYNGANLQLIHPSYCISAKAKYAFDPRIGASYKHLEDIKQIMQEDRLKQYYQTVKRLQARDEVFEVEV